MYNPHINNGRNVMTKKDYIAIAACLKANKPLLKEHQDAHRTWRRICEDTANLLSRDNSHFDHNKFLEACGY
jgi:hypothetical protein